MIEKPCLLAGLCRFRRSFCQSGGAALQRLSPRWGPSYIGPMLARIHSLVLTALLALGLVVSGHAAASAKGASPATGHMVLCIGTGLVVVFTDEDGQPTAAPHLCPDCMLAGLLGLPVAETVLVHVELPAKSMVWQSENVRPAWLHITAARARAPPLPV